jgi:uncharacterized protein (DUF1501 family)
VKRRDFLALSAGATLALAARPAWAAAEDGPRRLVVVMLRGAIDGLNVVIPYRETAYYEARPRIAIAKPGAPDGALALDGNFALHPALAALLPLWREGQLAFVHAAGSPDPTRSHFDAQLFLENGTPGHRTTPDGWMNRLLAALPGAHVPAEALAIGPTVPQILRGRLAIANFGLGPAVARRLAIDFPAVARVFDRLYAGSGAQSQAYHEGRIARAELVSDLAAEPPGSDDSAPPGTPGAYGFPAAAQRLARVLARDHRVRLAFTSLVGWDTHIDQGSVTGQLAARLHPLGNGLAALARGLGRDWADTVVVVISEFGRTVHENGGAGTDHGHGNAIWVMGGRVKGGRVYGAWPGLGTAQLYQGRDLAVTTDYRDVLATVIARHLRLPDRALDTIFPGLPAAPPELAHMIPA